MVIGNQNKYNMSKKTLIGKDFHFGIGFLNELIDGTGMSLEELAVQKEVVLMPTLMYYSLLYSFKKEGTPVTFNKYDIFEWIEENGGIGGSFWTDFTAAYMESMYKDVPVDSGKKKTIPKAVK